jgi:RNase adaptor protein for sRNA GlmZ degradation
MKLIILYGPPAVGKLTIAVKLAEETGYKIFQNNPTVRSVEPIFDFGTPEFFRTLAHVRLIMLEEAAQSDLDGLIFTFCYDPNTDEQFITDAISVVERAGGTVHLVQLTAPKSVLLERVRNDSRRIHGKILTEDKLQTALEQYDFFTPYPRRESLSIDTSAMSAEEAAAQIVAHFGL